MVKVTVLRDPRERERRIETERRRLRKTEAEKNEEREEVYVVVYYLSTCFTPYGHVTLS